MKRNDYPRRGTRDQTIRIIEWISRARQSLAPCSETPNLDAELLIAHVKGRDRSWVLAHPESWIEPGEEQKLKVLLENRLTGEPLPYLLGEWDFFGRKFKLTKSVLIPRPDTETLVENALVWLRIHPACRLATDIGTGSGVIAISLAAEVPDLEILAIDSSPEALEVARENALQYKVLDRIRLQVGDLLAGVKEDFHLICANLPYIPSADLTSLPNLSFEPRSSLDGGKNGIQIIQRFLQQIPDHLLTPGLALLEIQFDQAERLMAFSRGLFPTQNLVVLQDLAGMPRILRIEAS
jgi:release factor glutamine methyltransferase